MIIYTQRVQLNCPYCDNEFKRHLEAGDHLIYCDVDDSPGCAELFAVRVAFVPDVTTYTLAPAVGRETNTAKNESGFPICPIHKVRMYEEAQRQGHWYCTAITGKTCCSHTTEWRGYND